MLNYYIYSIQPPKLMTMKRINLFGNSRKSYMLISLFILIAAVIMAFAPTTINDFFLKGSQPGQSGNLEHPQKCDNCHGGYDLAVEPAHNWRGSMMAQAMRDPLYLACLAIANQDAPDAGDLCIRCHSPSGWLEGRSIPTDGSALNNNDMEGVQCDFCHKLVKPAVTNPFPGDPIYTANTWPDDEGYLNSIQPNVPPQESNGMYVADNSNAKRGPFADANAKHKMEYSPFHQESAICGTCHDVSNPAYDVEQPDGSFLASGFDQPANSFVTYDLFPVERTYSEWTMSAYNTPTGIYSSQFGGNKANVSTCQDCHMMDVTGYGCNKKGVPLRDDLPLHDMTGGNTFVPGLIAQLFPEDVSIDALLDGVDRARYMLQNAATLDVTCTPNATGGYDIEVTVTNETGHKLPSGYPEGRRIWVNVQAYDASQNIVYESGAYDFITADLNHDADIKVYEIKPGLSQDLVDLLGTPLLEAGPSFHFAINNKIFSDNRIPPRGFTNANFEAIQSPVIDYSYADGQYWDISNYTTPDNTAIAEVEVTLYYQTLSKEYVTFLRDENTTNDAGTLMYTLWENNGKSEPEVMEEVEIYLLPPDAAFLATPESGYAPLTVQFTDQSTNNPDTWSWSVNGVEESTSQNFVYTFAGPGTFIVALIVSNSFGNSTATTSILVEELTMPVIFVNDMTVSRLSLNGNRKAGVCEVLIWDNTGNPVSGATVSASYSGPNSGNVSGVTDGSGIATLQSKALKNPGGEWCFTVTDVSKSGSLYVPASNVITTECETSLKSMGIGDQQEANIHIDQIFPNPVNQSSTIAFTLAKEAYVEVSVFNQFGQNVGTLLQGNREQGSHQLEWRAGHLPAGIYFIRISSAGDVVTHKLLKNN